MNDAQTKGTQTMKEQPSPHPRPGLTVAAIVAISFALFALATAGILVWLIVDVL